MHLSIHNDMILIADSGSTKTTWLLLSKGQVQESITTAGLNPYFHQADSFRAVIGTDLAPMLHGYQIDAVFFYGAGCSTTTNNRMVSGVLEQFFPGARTEVHHDILGAARALFGHGNGIACILGTGCNSCYFDGSDTHAVVDSLGYLFGDEGAGSYLGKLLLGAYLRKELPADLRDDFSREYGFTLEDILNALYNKPFPNRFLASFSHFMAPRQGHPFIGELLTRSFRDFFTAHIRKYDGYRTLPVGFVGSIAHHYKDLLMTVAAEESVNVERILSSPAEGLAGYHAARS